MHTDATRLALVVAAVFALSIGGDPTVPMLVLPPAAALLIAASYRRDMRVPALLLLFAAAVLVRVVIADRTGSDVLSVTTAAINRVLAGGSPYGVGYVESTPDGAPFPYGPVALLWYLPLKDRPDLIELGVSIAIAAMLLLRGRLLGSAIYATAPLLVASAVDGSNDTSLGFLLLAAFIVAGRSAALGAVLLAVAVAFKLSALAFVPVFFAWAGLRPAGAFMAASLLAWAPVAAWGIDGFAWSARAANDIHRTTIWSLGSIVRDLTGTRLVVLDQLRYAFGALAAVATIRMRRSLDQVFIAGSIVYLVTLFTGTWATFAYFAALGPMLCWRLDDWLGLDSRPLLEPARLPAFLRPPPADVAPIRG
jgi:hypothetical protein